MLIGLTIGVNPALLELGGQSLDTAIARANEEIALEARRHFGAGKIEIGRLEDGRPYWRHVALGVMVRVPDDLALEASRQLRGSLVPGVMLTPPKDQAPLSWFHGIWARRSFVDTLIFENSAVLEGAHAC